MKLPRSSFVFAVIALAIIALWLWHKKKDTEMAQVNQADTNTKNIVASQPIVQTSNKTKLINSSPSRPLKNIEPTNLVSDGSNDIVTMVLNANDADIAFYGRVEDQFSNGVPDAEINISVQYENANDGGIKRGQTISDNKGFFTISGYKGARLGIIPKKRGYVLATAGTSFRYSQLTPGFFVPDANNPTVIKMWKLQGTEPLINISKHYKLNYTPDPIHFDLIAREIVPSGGDLIITVNRPSGEISERNRQDWGLEVEAVDGGVMEATDPRITYAAPETGYKSNDTLSASSNQHGIELIQQSFFVESRNGQVYSKFDLSFDINSNPSGPINITFKGVANTNGSRNWEATAPQQ